MEKNALAEDTKAVDPSEREKKKNKTKKVIATTTYFIAVLCLLAGLFVPLFNCIKLPEGMPAELSKLVIGDELPERMMFRYLPSMFNGIFGKEILTIKSDYFLPFHFTPGKFDFMSLIGVLYTVVCVIALLMLIPVFLGSKKKNTSARCALGVEVLAMLVTLTYIAYKTYFLVTSGTLEWTDYNFLIAFGGVLLMAIIQTVSSKGGIGVSKVIGLVLTVIAVIALLDITLFIPKLADPLNKFSNTLKSGEEASFIGNFPFFGSDESGNMVGGILGIHGIMMLVDIKSTINDFKLYKEMGTEGIMMIVVSILLILVAVFTVINLISDVIGLSTGKKYKKDRSPSKNGASNTFALVRYILTLVFAAAIIVITFAYKKIELQTGLYLWLLVAVLLISIINAAARTAVDNARYKKGALAPSAEAQQRLVLEDPAFAAQPLPVAEEIAEPEPEQPAYEPLPVVEATPAEDFDEPAVEEPAYEPLPVVEATPATQTEMFEEEPVVEETPVVEPLSAPLEQPEEPEEITRTVYIYGGATDEFMDTLTDNEKVEFVELFLKKSKGTVNGVPDYQIDGDNSDFFPAVFVHINRYRNIVSDALMTKMYKQLGKSV